MPAFLRRDFAVRTEPAGLDPVRAYFELVQICFELNPYREWERALRRAPHARCSGASFAQLLDFSSELHRRAELRRDDARRLFRHAVDTAAKRTERRVIARRRRRERSARRVRDLGALLRSLRDLPLRMLELALIWPPTDEERARWRALFRRQARPEVPPPEAAAPPPRFDVQVRAAPRAADPRITAERVAAARKLHAALRAALDAHAHPQPLLVAQTRSRSAACAAGAIPG